MKQYNPSAIYINHEEIIIIVNDVQNKCHHMFGGNKSKICNNFSSFSTSKLIINFFIYLEKKYNSDKSIMEFNILNQIIHEIPYYIKLNIMILSDYKKYEIINYLILKSKTVYDKFLNQNKKNISNLMVNTNQSNCIKDNNNNDIVNEYIQNNKIDEKTFLFKKGFILKYEITILKNENVKYNEYYKRKNIKSHLCDIKCSNENIDFVFCDYLEKNIKNTIE